ncbi:MAG TPA: nuclear transport factor 2 family protein [Methylovirgula sp.]|nr:nuclear transport factor 2 family protein [Methylovirgula sp.]
MPENPCDIARAVYRAFAEKDRDTMETLLAEDFHFTSPLDNRIDRASFFKRCWPNNASITGFDIIHVAAAGDRVFVTYEGHSANGKGFRNTEILTIRGGKAVDAEVYFGWSIPHEAPEGGFISPG